MSCHDHHHDHGHGHEDGAHDHSDEIQPALQTLLYKQIDFDNIRTLNESTIDAGRKMVEKTWSDRLTRTPDLVSDADEQLLMFIPMTGVVKLHSILIRSEDSPSCPLTLKLFHNCDDLDFSTVTDASPTQTLQVSRTNDVQEIPVKRTLFGNAHSLSLFFESNHGEGDEDETRIYYLAFKGEFRQLNREPVEVLYEKAANPKDHDLIAGIGERGAHRQGM